MPAPPRNTRSPLALIGEFSEVPVQFLLKPGSNRIGLADDNEVVLRCIGVDPVHAMIEIEPDAGARIRDLESTNGTYVNGGLVGSGQNLRVGDEIFLGPARLELAALDRGRPASMPVNLLDGLDYGPINEESNRFFTAHVWARVVRLFADLVATASSRAADELESLAISFGVEGCHLLEMCARGPQPFLVRLGTRDLTEKQVRILCRQARAAAAGSEFHTCSSVTSFWNPQARLGLALTGDYRSRRQMASLLETLVAVAALALRRSEPTAEGAKDGRGLAFPRHGVQGQSRPIRHLYRQLAAVAPTDLSILLHGETGTGKEWLARTLHASSRRAAEPFVAINCAAIPRDLLEAELFGIEAGVATGVRSRPGKFAEAHGGTLFLDEIGDMPLDLQAKLLRVLQERRVEPLGGRPRPVDFRLLAASHHDILHLVENGGFRQDLYYRLAGCTLTVPPLREREGDVALLLDWFLRRAAGDDGPPAMTVEARRHLLEYAWPGNIRELENEVHRLVALCPPGQPVSPWDLSPRLRSEPAGSAARSAGAADTALTPFDPASFDPASHGSTLRDPEAPGLPTLDLAALEAHAIEQAMRRADGNQTAAAGMLGITRWSLRRRLVLAE